MRIRLPFAGAFCFLLLLAAYIGLLPHTPSADPPSDPSDPPSDDPSDASSPSFTIPTFSQSDKVLHLFSFFLLTLTFYWSIDTTRRRTLHLTLFTCTFLLCLGSEFLQAWLPNDREFDVYDIVANIAGSLSAVGLCTWYHKRMLERRRRGRYGALAGGDDLEDGNAERDVELGEAVGGIVVQQDGVVEAHEAPITRSLDEQVDNWDENEVDNWEDDDVEGADGPSLSNANGVGVNGGGNGKVMEEDRQGAKKRAD